MPIVKRLTERALNSNEGMIFECILCSAGKLKLSYAEENKDFLNDPKWDVDDDDDDDCVTKKQKSRSLLQRATTRDE